MDETEATNRRLRPLHLASGLLIASFLTLHLFNHLAMVAGAQRHIELMGQIRPFYRNAIVEPVLLAALVFQIGSGIVMIWKTRRSRAGAIPLLQAVSGIVLALFICNHVIAVLAGRVAFDLDTNYHFAIAGFQMGRAAFFVPYYFAGVAALFVHVACALTWRMQSRRVPIAVAIGGIALAIGFVMIMWEEQDVPDSYLAIYR